MSIIQSLTFFCFPYIIQNKGYRTYFGWFISLLNMFTFICVFSFSITRSVNHVYNFDYFLAFILGIKLFNFYCFCGKCCPCKHYFLLFSCLPVFLYVNLFVWFTIFFCFSNVPMDSFSLFVIYFTATVFALCMDSLHFLFKIFY